MKKTWNLINLTTLGASFLLLILSCVIVWKEWRGSRLQVEASVINTARLLADQVEASLDQADSLLVSVGKRYLAESPAPGRKLRDFAERIRSEIPYHPLVARIGITDAGGMLVLNTGFPHEDRFHVDLADREYFARAKAGERGLLYEGPIRVKLTGEWALTLARAIVGKDGGFRGVVFAGLPVASIGLTFSRVDLGPAGIINLRTQDLAQVVRHPVLSGENQGNGNRNVSQAIRGLLSRYPDRDHHVYVTIAPIDGIERIYAYQRFAHSPFWMTVGRATADSTSAWKSTAAMMGLIAVGMIGFMGLAAGRLNKQAGNLMRRILEEKRARRALRASEARFRQLFDLSPVSIWEEDFTDIHGRFQALRAEGVRDLRGYFLQYPEEVGRLARLARIVAGNDTALALVGAERREDMPRTVGDLLPPEGLDSFARQMCALFEGATRFESENLLVKEGGGRRNVLVRLSVMPSQSGDLSRVLVTLVDVTKERADEVERHRLELEVSHLQRIEGLGRLAAGMAHDMNNVLGSIMSIAAVLQIRHEGDRETEKDVETLLLASSRGRDLVKQLRDFSRKDLDEAGELDLNAMARLEAELLERTTLKRVQVRLDLDPALPLIRGQAALISSAVMNLCVNALDAMPEGGTLVLATRSHGQEWAELSVEDSGQGMPPEVLAKAQEPFFTTKPFGKGSGLGLSQVHGTMKAHGGTLELRSEPGVGTKVSLLFPAPAAQA